MSFESCQEIFTLTPYVPKGLNSNELFNGYLHMYECRDNIKFGVFNADKKECEFNDTEKYQTILAELTLRDGVNLIFGDELINLDKSYKFHVASQVLTKVGSSTPARSDFPFYKSNNSHICESIIDKAKNTTGTEPMPAIGDFMCARPLLIYKNGDSKTMKNKISEGSSNYSPLVLSLNYQEQQGRRRKLKFDKYNFIVCCGPYNQIILCAIKKFSPRYTRYINIVERFNLKDHYLAVAINDRGNPSDYMEVTVHFKHALYSVNSKNGNKEELLSVRRSWF